MSKNTEKEIIRVREAIKSGAIKTFSDIYTYTVDDTIHKKAIKIGYYRFLKVKKDPSEFKIKELIQIAGYYEVDPDKLIGLIMDEVRNNGKTKS